MRFIISFVTLHW